MATLVLTVAGSVVGGPVGATIGAIIGQQVDSRLFAPKGRHGPRLGELSVQTSSYGTPIPRLFGKMRVAGTVIWSTDLQESRSTSGGKGRPKTTNYSYSASFAVALSARAIRSVGRIWADGKLLRGAGGDFKSETAYRLYTGSEDQAADPLIAAAEGASQAPAFRGIAYAMFEDFQLADYGNRIPSLSFEVEADEGPVTIGTIAEMLSGGAVTGGSTPSLLGYAASGDSVRAAIEALGQVVPLTIGDDGASLVLRAGAEATATISEAEAGASGPGRSGGRSEFARRDSSRISAEVSVAYHDPARDYPVGLQRATRHGPAARAERLSLPAVLGAGAAKAIVERRLAALWASRTTAKLHLLWRRADIVPGTVVRIQGRAGLWKVERWTLDRMVASLELVRMQAGPIPETAEASEGRPIGHPDLLHGPTTVRLLDLPLAGRELLERPHLLVAAAGVEAGWRRAALMTSYNGGATWQEAGPTAAPAVMGTAVTVLDPGGAALIDAAASVEIELLNDALWLESRSDEALVGGANLASIGDELIQFGRAEPLGNRRFRLSRLLRGRRGTEWAMTDHVAGEPFVLIEPASLAVIEPPLALIGGEARLLASGLGDIEPVEATVILSGEAVRPPAPVHLAAERSANGDLAISWVRRSRIGWTWLSGTDTPLAEESEAYELTLSAIGMARTVTISNSPFVYSVAAQAADGAVGEIAISVRQLGTLAPSRPAQILVPAES